MKKRRIMAFTQGRDLLSEKQLLEDYQSPPHLQCLRQNLGALLNETLHWVDMNLNDTTTITAFDLAKEEFRQLLLPAAYPTYIEKQGLLELLGEQLCLWRFSCVGIQFWVMREYNVPESWTLLHKITTDSLLPSMFEAAPVFVTESGTVVLSMYITRELITIECYKEEKPVCSGRYRVEAPRGPWFRVIQYAQTLLNEHVNN